MNITEFRFKKKLHYSGQKLAGQPKSSIVDLLESQNRQWRARDFGKFYLLLLNVLFSDNNWPVFRTWDQFMTVDSSQWVHQHLCIWILRPLSYEELSNKNQWIFAPDSSHQRTVRCFITVRCYKTAGQWYQIWYF